MGGDETVGEEIVEPEVEDLKSDAWRHLKKNLFFQAREENSRKNEVTDHKVKQKSLYKNPWLCTTNFN